MCGTVKSDVGSNNKRFYNEVKLVLASGRYPVFQKEYKENNSLNNVHYVTARLLLNSLRLDNIF